MGLARDVLSGLEERLHEHAGFDLPRWVVEARALARMSALALDETAYLELVNSPGGAAELRALVEAVRVGETSFFRHRPQVDALLDVVVPAWRERDHRAPRVWSAGCATGEEPYTIALVLARALPRPAFAPAILATDVSEEALAVAERATYPKAAADDVPANYRDGLSIEGESARIRPEIASLVRFRHQNLADADAPRGFDLVWCRNVLIYFGPEARRRVLDRLVGALQPGGFLFLGYSETLRDVGGLTAVRYGDQVLWQKPLAGAPLAASSRPPVSGGAASAAPSRPPLSGGAAPAVPSRPPVSRGGGALVKVPVTPSMGALVKVPVSANAGALVKVPVGSGMGALVKVPVTPDRGAGGRGPAARGGAAIAPAPALDRGRGRTAVLRLTASEPAALAAEIRGALAAQGLGALTIDLDGADFIEDAIAPVLRRAAAAAEAAGIDLVLRATRPGPQRWLRRNGLGGGAS